MSWVRCVGLPGRGRPFLRFWSRQYKVDSNFFGVRKFEQSVDSPCELLRALRSLLCLFLPHSIFSLADSQAELENRSANAPLLRFVNEWRTVGHLSAELDPLGLNKP